MSCKKAGLVLTENTIDIEEEHNAGKEPYTIDAVLELLTDIEKVFVTSGKKILEFDDIKNNDEMLKKIMGRSGNLRAPSLRIGSELYVGYNEELYGRFGR